jgi:hypothetical protein
MSRTKYNETFPTLAEKYAREGMIDREIAKKLGIGVSTYHLYENRYPEFLEAIKKGKAPVDDDVEKALLKRALGFEYEETMAEYSGATPKPGKRAQPSLVRRTKKMVPPDVAAIAFWLKNRRPEKWRDRHDFQIPEGLTIKVVSAVPRPEAKDPKAGQGSGK